MTEEHKVMITELDLAFLGMHILRALEFYMMVLEKPELQHA